MGLPLTKFRLDHGCASVILRVANDRNCADVKDSEIGSRKRWRTNGDINTIVQKGFSRWTCFKRCRVMVMISSGFRCSADTFISCDESIASRECNFQTSARANFQSSVQLSCIAPQRPRLIAISAPDVYGLPPRRLRSV